MNLEDQLRTALKRREPPPGFAERVLAKAESGQTASRNGIWRLSWLSAPGWAAAVAVAAVLVLTVGSVRDYRQRQLAEQARNQVVFALELARSKVSFAQQRVLKAAAATAGVPEKP